MEIQSVSTALLFCVRKLYTWCFLLIYFYCILVIKPLWAVLYTSEQVCWPDGCSYKWGEMSEALLRTWAVRRTGPALHCQHRSQHTRAEHILLCWHKGDSHRNRDEPSGDCQWKEKRLLGIALPELSGCAPEICSRAKTPPKYFLCFLPGWCTSHRFCYKHYTKEFKASFEWDLSKPPLLAGFQNHNLAMLHLTLITSTISSAW